MIIFSLFDFLNEDLKENQNYKHLFDNRKLLLDNYFSWVIGCLIYYFYFHIHIQHKILFNNFFPDN